MRKIILLLLILPAISFSQQKDPDVILKRVVEKFSGVRDYIVDINIKIDVDFLKVPETEAKIYFKQPNKIHIESESFAMLPKEGIDFSPVGLLNNQHTAIFDREEKISGYNTYVIKVIPIGETDEIILSTLWVDQSMNIIRRVESTTKTNGTFSIDLKYDEKKLDYPLPREMVFTFNVDKLNIPKGISGDYNADSKEKEDKAKTSTGKVYIEYTNYKVNSGISDKIFEEKKK